MVGAKEGLVVAKGCLVVDERWPKGLVEAKRGLVVVWLWLRRAW